MRGNRLPRKRSEAVAFAKALAESEGKRRRVFYHNPYPNGGGVPREIHEVWGDLAEHTEQFDCVGAVMTFLGCDRVQRAPWPFYYDLKLGYGYVNCNTMIKDALGPKLLFEEVRGAEVKAGDIVVFGGIGLVGHGHVGLLTGNKMVVHCSPGNSRKLGHALAETDAQVFLGVSRRKYLRYKHWIPE